MIFWEKRKKRERERDTHVHSTPITDTKKKFQRKFSHCACEENVDSSAVRRPSAVHVYVCEYARICTCVCTRGAFGYGR